MYLTTQVGIINLIYEVRQVSGPKQVLPYQVPTYLVNVLIRQVSIYLFQFVEQITQVSDCLCRLGMYLGTYLWIIYMCWYLPTYLRQAGQVVLVLSLCFADMRLGTTVPGTQPFLLEYVNTQATYYQVLNFQGTQIPPSLGGIQPSLLGSPCCRVCPLILQDLT